LSVESRATRYLGSTSFFGRSPSSDLILRKEYDK
jgi:hypothetical protein